MGGFTIGEHADGTPWERDYGGWQFNQKHQNLPTVPMIQTQMRIIRDARKRNHYHDSDKVKQWLEDRGVTVEIERTTIRAKW